ncbi:GTP diphosphokinase [Oleispira antarctica RB-8]|uniref:GTP pyrophosphokinase n=1 Tax=Oleispira antarctica RB-8 TaxID=698738 RepID=R4YLJ4_OLEAN|nr:GTP diphosphokinase [Oleispira antarctica RB-8]
MVAKIIAEDAVENSTYWTIDSAQMGLEMAQILAELQLDEASILAAILYRAVREGRLSLVQVRKDFDDEVATLIEGVLRMAAINAIQNTSEEPVLGQREAQVDNLRKMLVSVIDDVRVALIKLAERTAAIRAVKDAPESKRIKVAREVFNIYGPLAHRLGIGHLKWELEDVAFRYLEPLAYQKIATLLDEKRLARQDYIANVVKTITNELESSGIECEVNGRAKHIYSIWRKMKRKNIEFSQVYDVRAVRILVPTLRDCYAALGIIHSLWRHIPNEFDDYIANPKENGYQSLHTAVIGPGGKGMEVQIRTQEMHEDAELGVCAHWKYKGTDTIAKDQAYEQKIAWLRQVVEWHEEIGDLPELMTDLRSDINPDRIYIFTPDGHVVDLPPSATPIDFAYRVHTEIGHRTRGAKVNGRIVPLTYQLKTGEQVEILTAKEGRPSRDWMNQDSGYINTARARAKVAHWFKLQAKDTNQEEGRQLLMRELDRLDLVRQPLAGVAKAMNMKTTGDLFAGIGAGDIRLGQVVRYIVRQADIKQPQQELPLVKPSIKTSKNDDITIQGVGHLLTQIATCCKPVPGDDISGYVTVGRGVSVHRQDCENLMHLEMMEPQRIIAVNWGGKVSQIYPVDVDISAYDRTGLLRDVSLVLADSGVNVVSVNTKSEQKDHLAHMQITVEIDSLSKLGRVLNKLNQLPNVLTVRRARNNG